MLKEGDWILVTYGDKKYLRRLDPRDSINVRKDVLKFSQIIGKKEGIRIGKFAVFKPSLEDIILYGFRRETQIVYPKDSFFISIKLGAGPGKKVLDFGTGSGAMCAVFSWLGCKVHSFEVREKFYKNAVRNLERFGLADNVILKNEDFLKADVPYSYFDCAFVDVRDPLPYLEKVHLSLIEGGNLCFLLPTTNQVADLLDKIGELFGSIEVMEILIREYNVNAKRLRPKDTMIGHTAYLVFGRKLSYSDS